MCGGDLWDPSSQIHGLQLCDKLLVLFPVQSAKDLDKHTRQKSNTVTHQKLNTTTKATASCVVNLFQVTQATSHFDGRPCYQLWTRIQKNILFSVWLTSFILYLLRFGYLRNTSFPWSEALPLCTGSLPVGFSALVGPVGLCGSAYSYSVFCFLCMSVLWLDWHMAAPHISSGALIGAQHQSSVSWESLWGNLCISECNVMQ